MPTKKSKTAEQWVQQFPEDLLICAKEKMFESGEKQNIEILHTVNSVRENSNSIQKFITEFMNTFNLKYI